jgi:hypothetical protein
MTDRPQLLQRELDELMKKAFTPGQRAGMGATQKREIRRMFMAGAQAFSGLLLKHLEHTEAETVTELDLALMDALMAELEGFGEDLAKGLA